MHSTAAVAPAPSCENTCKTLELRSSEFGCLAGCIRLLHKACDCLRQAMCALFVCTDLNRPSKAFAVSVPKAFQSKCSFSSELWHCRAPQIAAAPASCSTQRAKFSTWELQEAAQDSDISLTACTPQLNREGHPVTACHCAPAVNDHRSLGSSALPMMVTSWETQLHMCMHAW